MKNFTQIFACLALFAASCQPRDRAQQPDSSPAPMPSNVPAGVHFQFSTAPAAKGGLNDGDWCSGDFSESLVINPDRNDVNSRYCILGDGVYKVVVSGNKGVSSFIVRRSGAQLMELYTGTQFPMCLSSRNNFSLTENAVKCEYDNKGGGIRYTAGVATADNWTRLELTFPAEYVYGLTVLRCLNCK